MNLSVIMPVFNEEKLVKQAIVRLLAQNEVKELIVVDDGSKDTTKKIIKNLNDKRIVLLEHKNNQGKGSAIRTGLDKVTGDYVLIHDADLEYDPKDIKTLTQPIKEGKTDVVYGSRFMGPHSNMLYWHYVGNKFLNFLINILYNTTLSDMETCYKLIPPVKFFSFLERPSGIRDWNFVYADAFLQDFTRYLWLNREAF